MGRVSKYRKPKNFNQGRDRGITLEKEIDPMADDMPKSLKRLLQKKKMIEEKRENPQKRKKRQANPEIPVFEDIRPGESVIDFSKRIDAQTKGHLTNQWKETKRISQRKKNYYERRKETIEHRKRSKKRKRVESSDDEQEEEEEEEEEEEDVGIRRRGGAKRGRRDVARSFSNLKDEVSFGEVAEAPPLLTRKNKRRKVTHEDGEVPISKTTEEKRQSMEALQKQVRERYRERKKKIQEQRDL